MLRNFFSERIALDDLKFLFVLCPNNSGTTVISQYIAEQTGGFLPPFGNNEGQMAPAVVRMMRNRPWNERSTFDWSFIRAEWEKLSQGRLFIEGSPPNIMRVDAIAEIFGADSSAILSICDPYQQIASCTRRYREPGFDPAKEVKQWVKKARKTRNIHRRFPHFPLFRYDDFVTDPTVINSYFQMPIVTSEIKGKRGSDGAGIVNMRGVTTLFLNEDELDRVSAALKPYEQVVTHFGYELKSGKEIIADLSGDGEALKIAQARRNNPEPRVRP